MIRCPPCFWWTLHASEHPSSEGVQKFALTIDKHGGFYWQGKQVNVKRIVLTFGQKVYAFVGITAAALVAMSAIVQGVVTYNQWACTVHWVAICP